MHSKQSQLRHFELQPGSAQLRDVHVYQDVVKWFVSQTGTWNLTVSELVNLKDKQRCSLNAVLTLVSW